MTQGKPVAAGKEFGKRVGRAAQKVGDGVVQAGSPDSGRGDREEQRKQEKNQSGGTVTQGLRRETVRMDQRDGVFTE